MKTLFALLLICMWASWAAAAPPACSHWASPNGSGSTCSESQPCTVGQWLGNQAGPGKVLCLHDGRYTGDNGMLQFSAKSGTSGSPITVRAVNDGAVEIDGEFERRPLDCNASYITVQGVNLKNGNDNVIVLRGQHCTAQRVVGWATESSDGGIENIADLGGSHNLLEDCGIFGFARKQIACGARGGNGPNTIRRCWSEHNGSRYGSAQGNPTEVMELGYNQNFCVGENIIARRNILSSATEPEAPYHAFSTHGSALLGSISYALSTDNFDTNILLNITPEAGSHAGSGHVTEDFLLQDVVLLADPAQEHIRGYQIDGGSGSRGNVAKRIVSVTPQQGQCGGDGWSCTEIYEGRTLEQAMGGKSIWDTLPGICKRVVNRQITDVGLWPFPMTERIQTALASARMPQKNVTEHVSRSLGTIPEKCLSGTPPGPGPGPGPAVPVPPTNVTATMQGTGVLIGWTDTINTNQTGYVVERKVPPSGYDHLANVTGAATRSYTDASPVVGSSNCYVVYARAQAGPSGFSPEACVQVGAPPGPGGSVPLTCEGSLGQGGLIQMQCHPIPQAGRRR